MMVKLGNWLFHYRNFLFPVLYLALFIPSRPFLSNETVSDITGILLIFSGILVRCITIGLVYIVRGGNKRSIHAEELVTGGIYGICRNPMYLGNILLLLGFGFFSGSLVFMLIFMPLFVIFYMAIIKAEETFLTDKFGDTFVAYKNNVNALLPDPGKVKEAFKGQSFKWKRVLIKEYNSLAVYILGILLLLLYKSKIELSAFIVFFVILIILYAIVKWMKNKKVLAE
jgi:protein-S-isoprenylcysteine O-methyltransferase Ste14